MFTIVGTMLKTQAHLTIIIRFKGRRNSVAKARSPEFHSLEEE